MAVAAILMIASVAVAIVANFDLDRQKRSSPSQSKLGGRWRPSLNMKRSGIASPREHSSLRRSCSEKPQNAIQENTAEIERLEEEEKTAKAEGGGEESKEEEQKDPHAIKDRAESTAWSDLNNMLQGLCAPLASTYSENRDCETVMNRRFFFAPPKHRFAHGAGR